MHFWSCMVLWCMGDLEKPVSPHHTVIRTVICASGFCSFPYCTCIAKEIGTFIQGRVQVAGTNNLTLVTCLASDLLHKLAFWWMHFHSLRNRL
jgi:hypothetical protein